jgi:hypothetical protein
VTAYPIEPAVPYSTSSSAPLPADDEVGPRWRRRAAPTQVRDHLAVRVDPRVVAAALQLADGDARRVVLHLDGTATVLNRPKGSRR